MTPRDEQGGLTTRASRHASNAKKRTPTRTTSHTGVRLQRARISYSSFKSSSQGGSVHQPQAPSFPLAPFCCGAATRPCRGFLSSSFSSSHTQALANSHPLPPSAQNQNHSTCMHASPSPFPFGIANTPSHHPHGVDKSQVPTRPILVKTRSPVPPLCVCLYTDAKPQHCFECGRRVPPFRP